MIKKKFIKSLFLRQLFFGSTTNRFAFSLSQQALKAIWARAIINKITFSNSKSQGLRQVLLKQIQTNQVNIDPQKKQYAQNKNQLYLSLPDLSDVILKMSIDSELQMIGEKKPQKQSEQGKIRNQEELQNKVRNHMMSYFVEGTELNTMVFSQSRFKNAQKQQNQGNLMKYVFFPTYTVTGKVFKIFQKLSRNTIVYGQKGISKSTSLVLRAQLGNEMTALRIKYAHNKQQIQKVKKVVKIFQKNIYWAINTFQRQGLLTNKDKINYIIKLIEILRIQCSDIQPFIGPLIDKKQKQIFESLQKEMTQENAQNQIFNFLTGVINLIRENYQAYNISVSLIVDQINSLASQLRKANEEIKAFEIAKNQKNDSFKLNPKYQKSSFLLQILNSMRQIANRKIIYSTSIKFEQDILSQKLDGKFLRLKLNDRDLPDQEHILFNRMEIKEIWEKQLRSFFKFQLNRLKIDNTRAPQAQNIYNKFPIVKLPTPLDICILANQISNNKLTVNQSFNIFHKQKNKQILLDFTNFLGKRNKDLIKDQKMISIEVLRILLMFLNLPTNQKNQNYRIYFSQNDKPSCINVLNLQYFKISQENKKYYIETNLTKDHLQKFYFSIFKYDMSENQIDLAFHYQEQFNNFQNRTLLGIIYELWFLSALVLKNQISLLKFISKEIQILKYTNSQQMMVFQKMVISVKNIEFFKLMFNQNTYSLRNHFHIDQLKLNQPTIYIPIKSKKYQSLSQLQSDTKQNFVKESSSNNEKIDAVIIQKVKIAQIFKIKFYFLQFIVSKDDLFNKIKDTSNLLQKIPEFDDKIIKSGKEKCHYEVNLCIFFKLKEYKYEKWEQNFLQQVSQELYRFENKMMMKGDSKKSASSSFNAYLINGQDVSIKNGNRNFTEMLTRLTNKYF